MFHARGPAAANDRSPNDDVVRSHALSERVLAEVKDIIQTVSATDTPSGATVVFSYDFGAVCKCFDLLTNYRAYNRRD